MGAAPKMNIVVKVSKEHLDVIDKELTRMHASMETHANDEKMLKWCQERIQEMQVALVTLKQSIASSVSEEHQEQ